MAPGNSTRFVVSAELGRLGVLLDEHTLWFNQPSEWEGIWWADRKPNCVLSGKLVHRGSGEIFLDVDGGFDPLNYLPVSSKAEAKSIAITEFDPEFARIYGEINGRPVTLMGCLALGGASENPSVQRTRVSVALFGIHLLDGEDSVFKGMRVSLENLKMWAQGTSRASVKTDTGNRYILENPSADTVAKELSGLGAKYPGICSEDVPFIQVEFSRPYDFVDVTQEIIFLRCLMVVATRLWSGINWLSLDVVTADGLTQSVSVIYRSPFPSRSREQYSSWSEPVFDCTAAAFEDILCKWDEVYGIARRPIIKLVENLALHDNFIDREVLSAASALETFHDNFYPDHRPFEDKLFRQAKEAALKAVTEIDPELTQHFSEGMQNRPTFVSKLSKLVTELGEELAAYIFPKVDFLIKEIKNQRHGLAHSELPDERRFQQLVSLKEMATNLGHLFLLRKLGFNEDTLERFVQREDVVWEKRRAERAFGMAEQVQLEPRFSDD